MISPETKFITSTGPDQQNNVESVFDEEENQEKKWEEEIKKKSRKILEGKFQEAENLEGTYRPKDPFLPMDLVQRELELAAATEEELDNDHFPKKYSQALKIFLEELVDFSISKEKQDPQKAEVFLHIIRIDLFSSSPNISSNLNFNQAFDFAAKSTRSKLIQRSLGGGIIGELSYRFGWDYKFNPEKDAIFEDFNQSTLPDKLDKLNLIEILGAYLIGHGSSFNHGDEKLLKLLEKIWQSNDNAFVSLYIQVTLERLGQEYEDPSIGIVQLSHNPGNARLQNQLREDERLESDRLQEIIIPSRPIQPREKMIRIAKDVIAILNHANLPTSYVRLEESSLSSLEKDSAKSEMNFVSFEEIIKSEGSSLKNFSAAENDLLFQHLYRPEMRQKIETEFNIKLRDLPFRFHIHFLKFLSEKSIEELEKAKNFINQGNKINQIKTFLSLELGQEMGEKILTLGEKLPQETAEAIFQKYSEIVDETERAREYLKENFGIQNPDETTLQSIQENLLSRAKDLLVYFADNLADLKPEEITQKLEGIKSEVILLASSWKEARENDPGLSLESIKNLKIEEIPANQITNEDKQKMLQIFVSNRQDNSDYSPELLSQVKQEFEKAFENPKSTFFILRDGEDIISFIRFDEIDAETLYTASFNVRNEGRQSGIGKAMMKTVLDKKAQEYNLAAVAFDRNPALRMYQQDFEFEIIGQDENYKGTGKTFYRLLRRKEKQFDLAA